MSTKKSLKKKNPAQAAKRTKPAASVSKTATPRRIKPASRNRLGFKKRTRHPATLPSVWTLARISYRVFRAHWRILFGVTAVYGALNVVLAQGIGSTDVTGLKADLATAFGGNFSSLGSSLSIFAVLLGSAGNTTSQTAGAYQVILAVIASLAVIWALRQLSAGNRIRIRDAYYAGMYPLVPFIIILTVMALQLVPLAVGSSVYNLIVGNGIAVHVAEQIFWLVVFCILSLTSLYMISASIFALYIVTLPDMAPMQALRSARELVRHRRWTVLRKILFLPLLLMVVAAGVMLPIIIWLTPLAQYVFFVLTMLSLAATHTYMYSLYRELLHES